MFIQFLPPSSSTCLGSGARAVLGDADPGQVGGAGGQGQEPGPREGGAVTGGVVGVAISN